MNFEQTNQVVRFVSRSVVSSGAAAIVTNAVKATTPADLTKLKKLTVVVGTLAVSGAVAEVASKHFSKTYDEIVDVIRKAKNGEDPVVIVTDI